MTSKFTKSSQYKYWFFDSAEKLREIRNEVNKAARERILSFNSPSVPSTKKKKAKTLKEEDLLNAEEELLLVSKNIQKISALCDRFKFPLHVEATAILFFKRFFLAHSIMEYDVSLVL